MDDKEKHLLENERQYLSLQYLITMKRLHGEAPSEELIMQARQIDRLAGIPEEELKSL